MSNEIIYEGDGDPHHGDVNPPVEKIVNLPPPPPGPIRYLANRVEEPALGKQGPKCTCGHEDHESFCPMWEARDEAPFRRDYAKFEKDYS